MNTKELIRELVRIEKEFGDIEVTTTDWDGCVRSATIVFVRGPQTRFRDATNKAGRGRNALIGVHVK